MGRYITKEYCSYNMQIIIILTVALDDTDIDFLILFIYHILFDTVHRFPRCCTSNVVSFT